MLQLISVYGGRMVSCITVLATDSVSSLTNEADPHRLSFLFISYNDEEFFCVKMHAGDREVEAIDEVFAMFEASSCITFVKHTIEEFYVSIQKTGDG